MQYVHIKNIKRYNPGYTDRKHLWSKIYWDIFLDENFQTLSEIARYRLISLIVFEVYYQKPVPLTDMHIRLLGWDVKKLSIQLTLQMLHTFLSGGTTDFGCHSHIPLIEKRREEKRREDMVCVTNKLPHGDFVLLTEEEFKKLESALGSKLTGEYINKLNNYIGSKGTKYKSHYHTILMWASKDGTQHPKSKVDVNTKEFEEKLESWKKEIETRPTNL